MYRTFNNLAITDFKNNFTERAYIKKSVSGNMLFHYFRVRTYLQAWY
jgi:hypothetical protein